MSDKLVAEISQVIQHGLDLGSHRLVEVVLDMTNRPAEISSNHQAGFLHLSQVFGQYLLGRMSQFTPKLAESNRPGTDGTQDMYLPFALNEVNSVGTRAAVIL